MLGLVGPVVVAHSAKRSYTVTCSLLRRSNSLITSYTFLWHWLHLSYIVKSSIIEGTFKHFFKSASHLLTFVTSTQHCLIHIFFSNFNWGIWEKNISHIILWDIWLLAKLRNTLNLRAQIVTNVLFQILFSPLERWSLWHYFQCYTRSFQDNTV